MCLDGQTSVHQLLKNVILIAEPNTFGLCSLVSGQFLPVFYRDGLLLRFTKYKLTDMNYNTDSKARELPVQRHIERLAVVEDSIADPCAATSHQVDLNDYFDWENPIESK